MDYPYSEIRENEFEILKNKIKDFKNYIKNRMNYLSKLDSKYNEDDNHIELKYRYAELDRILKYFDF